jgi:hypothetical protein
MDVMIGCIWFDAHATTRATLLADKLRNVSKVARWKDLRDKDYPPFVYEGLDTMPENEVST